MQDDGSVTLVKPRRPMNMRDVLMHTTGLPGGLFPGNPIDDAFATARSAQGSGQTLESVTALLAEHPLKFHPGTHWNYGLSTDIVGRLVEILSGMPFDEYLRREIFEPLGMVDTGFFVPEASLPRLAACYQHSPGAAPRLMEGRIRQRVRAPALLPLGRRRPGLHDRGTTSPSARCWPTAASSTADGCSGARPWSS